MARKPPKTVHPEDATLFREAVAGATPVASRRVALRKAPPRPEARFRRKDEEAVLTESLKTPPEQLEIETGEELLFHRSGVSRAVLKNLRRGKFAIKAEVDLHGLTVEQARVELRDFLAEAITERLHCVRVVHGKGLRSGPRGPVLKASVNAWLRRWDEVLAFCSAPARDGGTGALYVLLRR
jgi:DNA-nicking Smr family endonuclease